MGQLNMNTVKAILVTLIITLVPTYAFSGSSHPDRYYSKGDGHHDGRKGHYHGGEFCKKDHTKDATSVPEINAGGTSIALALLAGLVLVTRERRNSSRS